MEESVLTAVVLPLGLFIIMLGVGLSLVMDDFKRVVVYPKAAVAEVGFEKHEPFHSTKICIGSDSGGAQLLWTGLIAGIAYLVLAPSINKLMHGVK